MEWIHDIESNEVSNQNFQERFSEVLRCMNHILSIMDEMVRIEDFQETSY